MLKRFEETGTIRRIEGSRRPSKITPEVKAIINAQMRLDDETTAIQLYALLLGRLQRQFVNHPES